MTDEHGYPVRLEIDYPEDGLNRVTTAFRLVLAIPIAVVAGLLTTSAIDWTAEEVSAGLEAWAALFAAGGFVFLPTVLMILFRRKYPRWWFDWNQELMRFSVRVSAYLALLRDEYPSTDEQQGVHLDIDYPDARTGPQPLAPAGQVAAGSPTLRRAGVAWARSPRCWS